MSRIIHVNGQSRSTGRKSELGPVVFAEISPDPIMSGTIGSRADMIAAAEQEARRIRDEAYREGYEAGHQEAIEHVSLEANKLLDTLRDLNAELRREQQELIDNIEPSVVKLAVGIAEKILHRELTQDTSVVRTTVMEALRKLTEREKITVRVNSADVELLKEFKIDISETFGDIKEIKIVADENIARGGCVVETDMLRVNGDITAQLDQVQQKLME